jgi:hypothetical protein
MNPTAHLTPMRPFLASGAAAPGLALLAYRRAWQTTPEAVITMRVISCGRQRTSNMGDFSGIKV